jgi:hypothetical protein
MSLPVPPFASIVLRFSGVGKYKYLVFFTVSSTLVAAPGNSCVSEVLFPLGVATYAPPKEAMKIIY